MSYEDEDRTDHLHCAKELLGLVDNLHGDELDQAADLERGASAHALVDIAQSFRQFNSDRSQWYREVLEVLTQAKNPPPSKGFGYYAEDGSLRSGQPEAAISCCVCGKPDLVAFCTAGDLTREQWLKHHEDLYLEARKRGSDKGRATHWADDWMDERFGPCPEES